jgi:galactokinase
MIDLVARVREGFADAYGGAPDLIARAPGRVNLIGEHTDYNDGFVLPAAISGQTLVAAKRIAARRIEVVATDFEGERDSFLLDKEMAHSPDPHWADYVRGMVIAMERAGLRVSGAQLAVAGDVPRGAGLSSSASITVSMGVALGRLSKLTIDPTDLARMAQAAETDFVGTRVGIMDQLVSARGVAGHALLIDCRSLDCRPVPIPPDAAILIVHSGIERGLVDGAYNARRAQCEAAARARHPGPARCGYEDARGGACPDGRHHLPPRATRHHGKRKDVVGCRCLNVRGPCDIGPVDGRIARLHAR